MRVPEYRPLRLLKSGDSWEMIAVAAFASENIGKVPAVFSDVRPSREFLRGDLEIVAAGMLWKIAPREQAVIDLRYWDYPVRPEDIPRQGRRARGHWGYLTAEGTEMRPELYEDRFFLPLLWAQVRLGDWMLPKDTARALETYKAVLKVYPDALLDSHFAYHLGLAFYTTGRRGESAQVWDDLLKLKPPSEIGAFVQFYMGELHRDVGRPDQAVQYYRSALSSSPPPELKRAIEERLSGH